MNAREGSLGGSSSPKSECRFPFCVAMQHRLTADCHVLLEKCNEKMLSVSSEQGLLFEAVEGIARSGGLFELQVARVFGHGLFETTDFARQQFIIGQDLGRHFG